MASFTQEQSVAAPVGYTGASQGIRSSPNTAIGTLFTGLAETLDAGIKEQDRNVKENIKQDIFDEVDSVQAEFGVPEATDLQADADNPIANAPLAVQRANKQLDYLQTAYARGALKDSHYWARVNSVVRQLRGKYPGYREEIDQMVASVTGARPANALRSALMSEWEADSKKTSDLDKFVNQHLERLPPDYFDRLESDSPYTFNEVRKFVSRKEREEAERSDRRAAMSEADERGALQKKQVRRNFSKDAKQTVTSFLQDTTTAAGKTYKEVSDKLRDAQRAQEEGKPLSQTEVEALRPQLAQLKSQVRLMLHQVASDSWDDNPNHAYSTILDKKDIDDIVAEAMVPLDVMEMAITSENYGILGASASYLKAVEDDNLRDVLQNKPKMAKMYWLMKNFGADTALLTKQLAPPEVQASLDKEYRDYYALDSIDPRSQTHVGDALDDGASEEVGSDFYNGMLKDWVDFTNIVTSKNVSPEIIHRKVDFMFGGRADAVMAKFQDDQSRYEYFKKATSPSVTKNMLNLKNRGNEEDWNKYQEWVYNAFQILYRDKVQTLQTMVTGSGLLVDSDDFKVSYDTTNNRFKLQYRLAGDTFFNAPIQPNVTQLNQAIQNIVPIIKENGGDVSKELLILLGRMGYNPNAEKVPSLLNSLGEALRNVIAKGAKSVAGALPEVQIGGPTEERGRFELVPGQGPASDSDFSNDRIGSEEDQRRVNRRD